MLGGLRRVVVVIAAAGVAGSGGGTVAGCYNPHIPLSCTAADSEAATGGTGEADPLYAAWAPHWGWCSR